MSNLSLLPKILAVACLLVWANPTFAKCGKTNLVTPLSLDGDKADAVAIQVWWPSGSEDGWYLMFTNPNTLVSIVGRRFQHRDDASFNGYMFFRERHLECLHSDAKYFWLMKNQHLVGFYVVQSTVVQREKAEFHDDFIGASTVHELFKYQPGKESWERGDFKKVAETQVPGAKCGVDHLATDFQALFPRELADGSVQAPPACAE